MHALVARALEVRHVASALHMDAAPLDAERLHRRARRSSSHRGRADTLFGPSVQRSGVAFESIPLKEVAHEDLETVPRWHGPREGGFRHPHDRHDDGTVSRAATLKGWFVMVRDSRNTRQGNALWGDGWGRSWFDADKPLETTSTNYKANCQRCHLPAQSTNWIYVDGYPVLRH